MYDRKIEEDLNIHELIKRDYDRGDYHVTVEDHGNNRKVYFITYKQEDDMVTASRPWEPLANANSTISNVESTKVAEKINDLPETGSYYNPDKNLAYRAVNEIASAIDTSEMTNEQKMDFQVAYANTIRFIDESFAIYEGKKRFEDVFKGIDLSKVSYAFVVPARGGYSSEASQVVEIAKFLKPDESILHKKLFQRLLSVVPPFVLGAYRAESDKEEGDIVGLLVYSPQDLSTMEDAFELDLAIKTGETNVIKEIARGNRIALQIAKSGGAENFQKKIGAVSSARVNETVLFAQRITNSRIEHVGLGAILPATTELGRKVDTKAFGTEITTGHRMTINSMYLTMEKVVELDGLDHTSKINFGVVGSGYIGKSAADTTLKYYPNSKVYILEVNEQRAKKVQDELTKKYGLDSEGNPRVIIVKNIEELFENTKRIYSAATSPVNIPDHVKTKGVVIIDDSEPSAFNPNQLDKIEGVFVKPVLSSTPFGVHRTGFNYHNRTEGSYDYGWMRNLAEKNIYGPGLMGNNTFFGCEFEAFMGYYMKLKLPHLFQGKKNPILFRNRVGAADLEPLLNGGEISQFLAPAINPEILQGGGIPAYEKIRDTSILRDENPTTIDLEQINITNPEITIQRQLLNVPTYIEG